MARNMRGVALVWAEKRTPSRPRVQVFDTPPGPHVRTNQARTTSATTSSAAASSCPWAPSALQLPRTSSARAPALRPGRRRHRYSTRTLDDVDAEWTGVRRSDFKDATLNTNSAVRAASRVCISEPELQAAACGDNTLDMGDVQAEAGQVGAGGLDCKGNNGSDGGRDEWAAGGGRCGCCWRRPAARRSTSRAAATALARTVFWSIVSARQPGGLLVRRAQYACVWRAQ